MKWNNHHLDSLYVFKYFPWYCNFTLKYPLQLPYILVEHNVCLSLKIAVGIGIKLDCFSQMSCA